MRWNIFQGGRERIAKPAKEERPKLSIYTVLDFSASLYVELVKALKVIKYLYYLKVKGGENNGDNRKLGRS